MDTRASDRRGFFREAMIHLAREVAERTEQRVAPRRYFRPPGAADEIAFLASCTRCGDCLPVCPVHAIIKAPPGAGLAAGTPIIDPAIQACVVRSEEHTSELQSHSDLVCRLLLEKKKKKQTNNQ